jgi:hypothetical protein
MKTSPVHFRSNTGAFRPIDVAAIVSIVAALAALILLGAGRFREHALRTQCRSNLMQLGRALDQYSQANNGLLPDCSRTNPRYYGPLWPWDLHKNLAADLEKYEATRDAFYCPANPDMNDDTRWNFGGDAASMRIAGYGMLFPGIRQVPRNLWRTSWQAGGQTPPAQSELMFDATACVDDDFTRIQGALLDRSNHLRGKNPTGGNILFLDQRVEWRNFDEMEVRLSTFGTPGQVYWSF